MDLSPRQLSSLNEMGIVVWEFRSTQADQTKVVADEIYVEQTSEQLLRSDWLVMIDQQNYGKQAQQLLHAMLLAIEINDHQVAIIDSKQIEQLQNIDAQGKVLIVLGSDIAKRLLGQTIDRGAIHQSLNCQIATVVSFALDELLENPFNKAQAWQDLQLAKQATLQ